MSVYDKCNDYEEALKNLEKQMEEADKAWKRPLDTIADSLESPNNFPDRARIDALQAEANTKYKEFEELGRKRFEAFLAWVACLQANISN